MDALAPGDADGRTTPATGPAASGHSRRASGLAAGLGALSGLGYAVLIRGARAAWDGSPYSLTPGTGAGGRGGRISFAAAAAAGCGGAPGGGARPRGGAFPGPARFVLLAAPVLVGLMLLPGRPWLSTDALSYIGYGAIANELGSPYAFLATDAFGTSVGLGLQAYGWPAPFIALPYGPAWGLVMAALVRLVPAPDAALLVIKLIGFASAVGIGALLWWSLGRVRPRDQLVGTVLFAWNPVVIVELAAEGHNDGLTTLFAVLGLAFALRGQAAPSLIATAGGVLMKYVPAMLAPAQIVYLWRTSPDRRALLHRFDVGVLAAIGLAVVAFAPFWVGLSTFDALREQGAAGPWPTLPGALYRLFERAGFADADALKVVVAIAFGIAFLAYLLRQLRGIRDAESLVLACAKTAFAWIVLAAGSYHPWYLVLPIALFALAPTTGALVVVLVASVTGMASAPLWNLDPAHYPFADAAVLVTSLGLWASAVTFALWSVPDIRRIGAHARRAATAAVALVREPRAPADRLDPVRGSLTLLLLPVVYILGQALRADGSVLASALADPAVVRLELVAYWFANVALVWASLGLVAVARRGVGPRATRLLLITPFVIMAALAFLPASFSVDALSYVAHGVVGQVLPGENAYTALPASLLGTVPVDQLVTAGWAPPPLASPYGPLWTLIESAVAALPIEVSGMVDVFKLLEVAAAAGSAALIWRILGRLRPADRLAGTVLFAWNPLVLFELANEGHNDGVMTLFVLLGLAAALSARPTRAVFALGLGTLVKYVPVALGPAFVVHLWRTSEPRDRREVASRVAIGVGLGVVIAIALFAPVWSPAIFLGLSRVGAPGTSPSLGGALVQVVGGRGGDRAGIVGLLLGIVFAVYALVESAAVRDGPSLVRALAAISVVYALVASPLFYAWYLVLPIALLALAPVRPAVLLVAGLSVVGRSVAPLGDLRPEVQPFLNAHWLIQLVGLVVGLAAFAWAWARLDARPADGATPA